MNHSCVVREETQHKNGKHGGEEDLMEFHAVAVAVAVVANFKE